MKGLIDLRAPLTDRAQIRRQLFEGLRKSFFDKVAFDSVPERDFAIVLESDPKVTKWLRPPLDQMPIYYQGGAYNLDFVVETTAQKYLIGACLNPVCKYFRIPRVKSCQIITTKKPSAPLGIFSCSCGFIYSQRGATPSTNGLSRTHYVRAYGYVWESYLRRYWMDPSLSLRQMGKKLGVSRSTVKYHATRLELPEPGKGILRINSSLKKRLKKAQATEVRKRDYCRNQLLYALNKHPNANRTKLRLDYLPSGIYNWLLCHDRERAEATLPSPQRRGRPEIQMNNGIRDHELSNAVKGSVNRLKKVPGRPVRVTKSAIGKDINKVRLFNDRRMLASLPLTAKALTESVETRIEFAIRRIRWAAACFREESIAPSWTQLPSRAALWRDVWLVPEVKMVIDAAWLLLQQSHIEVDVEAA